VKEEADDSKLCAKSVSKSGWWTEVSDSSSARGGRRLLQEDGEEFEEQPAENGDHFEEDFDDEFSQSVEEESDDESHARSGIPHSGKPLGEELLQGELGSTYRQKMLKAFMDGGQDDDNDDLVEEDEDASDNLSLSDIFALLKFSFELNLDSQNSEADVGLDLTILGKNLPLHLRVNFGGGGVLSSLAKSIFGKGKIKRTHRSSENN